MIWLGKNKIFNCHSYTHLLGLPSAIFQFYFGDLLACLHASLCYPIVLYLPILITSHLFFACPFSFFFSMTFTFDTACKVFQIVLRDGGGPPVGGMENFDRFFFYWELGI